jgi:4-amino-4-deoxy-L-arabinose transferase-like glycosyltransferase
MKKTAGLILLGSLVFRLWFALGYWDGKPLTQDAQEYLELAKNLSTKGAFSYDAHPGQGQIERPGRAPGYPFWLAFLMRISPGLAWIRVVEVLISLLSASLFFLLARELFSVRAGLAALVISSLYVPLLWLIPGILSENLWIAFMLAVYWRLLSGKGSRWKSVSAFALLSAATLIRPGAVFLLPLCALWTYRTSGLKHAAICAALYLLLLLPWNLHLYRQEGRWIFVASEGGVTFWTGTHPAYSGDGDLAGNPPVQQAYRQLLAQTQDQTAAQREQSYWRFAKQNILADPAGTFVLELKKLLYWILPIGRSVRMTSLLHQITSMVFYGALVVLALMGFPKVPPETRLFFLGVLASFTLMALIFIPQERFRIATIDPILILIASAKLKDDLS